MNIEPRELRIGNWINSETYGDFEIVAMSVGFTNSSVFKRLEYYPQASALDKCHPILLTEEWLERLGAKPFPSGHKLELKGRLLWFAECENCFVDSQTSVYLRYVHQLQNLYFALTGEELTIKP
jgi:hypothetical protein